jgi:hypothetical protein
VTRKQRLIVRSTLAVVAGAAALLAVVVVGLALGFGISSSERKFDSADWRAWGGERWCHSDSPRLAMVEDLRANRLKLGMDRAAVMRLLGPHDYARPNSIEYGLGGSIDCEFLALDFDRRGHLILIERYQG